MKKSYQSAEFKAHCLEIMNQVHQTGAEVMITKRKVPLVKLVPFEKKHQPLFGCMKNTGEIIGDIIAPTGEDWDACH